MRIFLCFILMAFTADAPFSDSQLEGRAQSLFFELRCPSCQNQSLQDSEGLLAQDLRKVIREQMREGKSDKEIKAYLASRYGEFILFRPSFMPKNWVLWFAPFLLLLVIILSIFGRKRLL